MAPAGPTKSNSQFNKSPNPTDPTGIKLAGCRIPRRLVQTAPGKTLLDEFGQRINFYPFPPTPRSIPSRMGCSLPLDLHGGGLAVDYQNDIEGCNGQLAMRSATCCRSCRTRGRWLAPAALESPRVIGQDPLATWDAFVNRVANSCAPGCGPVSPRLIPVVLFNPDEFQHGRITNIWPGCPGGAPRQGLQHHRSVHPCRRLGPDSARSHGALSRHEAGQRTNIRRQRVVAHHHDAYQVINAMGTMTLAIVGARDRQLDELAQACASSDGAAIRRSQPAGASGGAAARGDRARSARRPVLPAAVAALRRQHPTTGIVIVAAALEPVLMLESMRAGVTEFVTAPLTAPELQAAISRVSTPAVLTAAGQVFVFLGAKGGVGTTTIAVNVATALAQLETGSTLLIDLHLAYGDAAIFLGTEPRFSVLDALDNVHRLDRAFFRGLVSHTRGGLDFLGSSDRASSRPVDAAAVRALVETASRHYRCVVLDVPRSDGVMLDVLEPASRIVIVANQELATVRAATRVAATLRQRYGKDRVSVVVSRFDKLANIGEDDVERVLGSRVAIRFRATTGWRSTR